jgi:hypothetical protein
MTLPTKTHAGPRDLLYFTNPHLWPRWPFLPVVRQSPDDAALECGVPYDARNASGRYGLSATVFFANICALPSREEDFLALPKRTYDTPDELAADRWYVD